MRARQRIPTLLGLAGLLAPPWPAAAVESRAPDPDRLAAARREGSVAVEATTDLAAARPLVEDFEALHPGVRVAYREFDSVTLNQRLRDAAARGAAMADIAWSSAMDLQVKAVNDGLAQPHHSPEAAALPRWAVWRDEAYGTTFEPIGVAYHRRLIADEDVPRSHADVARLLRGRSERFAGRVATYDLAGAGVGFLVATQDARASPLFWDIARALGRHGVRLHTSTGAMLDAIAAGETALAYNVLGSYAAARARSDPSIGFAVLRDYTLVVSRIALIPRRAAHPQAARLWLDHLLSRRGQALLAGRAGLPSLRADVAGDDTAAAVARRLGASLRPIAIGTSLLAYLDRSKRGDFLEAWKQAVGGGDTTTTRGKI